MTAHTRKTSAALIERMSQQQSASLYRALLRKVITSYYWKHTKICPFCGEVLEYDGHSEDCLRFDIERALDADDATVAAMLAALNEVQS